MTKLMRQKADGVIGVMAMLAFLEGYLEPEELERFYRITPNGSSLWQLFTDWRDRPGASGYTYFDFANELLAEDRRGDSQSAGE